MTDKAFERKIKALKVFCPEREDDCEWTGELVSLEHHLENQCGFVRVNCVFDLFGCEAKVVRMKNRTRCIVNNSCTPMHTTHLDQD